MDYVLTMVAAEEGGIDRSAKNHVLEEINPFYNGEQFVLSEGKAIDFFLKIDGYGSFRLPQWEGIDFFYQPVTNRRKQFLMADMDATIVTSETLDDLAHYVGVYDEVSAITARAMNGELGFEEALKARLALLRGLDESVLVKIIDKIEISPGAETLIKTLKMYDVHTVLASGGFCIFVQAIAKKLGFDAFYCNKFDIRDGALTGDFVPPIFDKESKLNVMKEVIDAKGITPEHVMAVGDGANDLAMLEYAGVGVGYYPKPVIEQKIPNKIVYGDLTALLYAQGYQEIEIMR